MSANRPASERPDLFKNAVIVLLTLISVTAAVVTFLQNYASLRSEDLVQRSEFTAVNSTGQFFRAGLEAGHSTELQERYDNYVQRSVRADTKARALRVGGQPELAADYDQDALRWLQAAQEVALFNPLLAEYGGEADLFREELSRDAYVEAERQQAWLLQSRAWSSKANSYVAILSTLSVALFLGGLSLTLSARVRYLLAASAAGLMLIALLWAAVNLFTGVPRIPDEAIEHFVDGEIRYNVSTARGETGAEAIPDFDAAIKLAPAYERAYFYRSLANTDFRLGAMELDTAQAIADGEKALALGNRSSPVYGNLGWLYILHGDYPQALTATETAIELSPDECYLHFNRGLARAALGREREADAAYDAAIHCALSQTTQSDVNYWLDVGVVDLQDLANIEPQLAEALQPRIRRLKEALASLRLFGVPQPGETGAEFGPLTFGEQVEESPTTHVVKPATDFPQSATRVYAVLKFSNMKPDSTWMTRWLLDGQENSIALHDSWEYGRSGAVWVSLSNNGGLNTGDYELDVFVDGRLMTSGRMTIGDGPLPPMATYSSGTLGVTISYPEEWRVTELSDTEVAVVAARNPDPDHPTFFGITSYLPASGGEQDIFALFDQYFRALESSFTEFSAEPREEMLVAGQDGYNAYYQYTNSDGQTIYGAVAGALDPNGRYVYVLVIETLADDWNPQLDVINAMLRRMSIDTSNLGAALAQNRQQ